MEDSGVFEKSTDCNNWSTKLLVKAVKERIVPLLHFVPILRVYEMARSLVKTSDKLDIEIIILLTTDSMPIYPML